MYVSSCLYTHVDKLSLNIYNFLNSLLLSVCYMHLLQLLVCVLPARCEERSEDVQSSVGGGAKNLPARGGLHRGLYWPKERF